MHQKTDTFKNGDTIALHTPLQTKSGEKIRLLIVENRKNGWFRDMLGLKFRVSRKCFGAYTICPNNVMS